MNNKRLKGLRTILLFIAIFVSALASVYMFFKDAKMIAFCFFISCILLLLNLKN